MSKTTGPAEGGNRIALRGKSLNSIKALRFGKVRAKITKRTSKSITVKVPPRGKNPSVVRVSAMYAGKWHKTRSSYRYVSATPAVPSPVPPVAPASRTTITSLSTATGLVVGGEKLTINGTSFDRISAVTMADTTASIIARTATSVTVLTPPSVVGATTVTVMFPEGTASLPFEYVAPTPSANGSIETGGTTFTAETDLVEWVTALEDEDETEPGYIVSLAPGAELPSADQPFYLPAGGAAYPSGLAGKVKSFAAQEDGSVRLTVLSVPLDEVFDQLDVNVTSEVDLSETTGDLRAHSSRTQSASAPSGSLGKANRSAFKCDTDAGFSGSLEIKVSDLAPHFETEGFGNPFVENKITAYMSGSTEVSGSVKAEGAMECRLSSAWQNSHRRVVYLPYGLTFSIAPEVHLSISAGGSVSIARSQSFLYGTHWTQNHGSDPIQAAGKPKVSLQGDASASITLEGGMSSRLGLLDRVGIEVEGLAYLEGQASVAAGAPLMFCIEGTYGLKAPVKLFLDYWIDENTADLFTIDIEFGSLKTCGQIWALPESVDPEITTASLPDATVGQTYSETLSTSDNRGGTWTTQSTLPPGLLLSPTGRVSGTPTGGVGSRTLRITFEDSDGKRDTSLVTLKVQPSSGLGGGDIQATLTWSHAADMDLHAFEPDGTEIFYSNKVSGSGGELDHDSNVGCGDDSQVAENIRWPARTAPSGTYDFRVVTYGSCGVADQSWQLVIRINGQVVVDRTGTGTSGSIPVNYGTGNRRLVSPSADPHEVSSPPKQ